MASTEPRKRLRKKKRSGRSIHQTAGDSAIQVGDVARDFNVYNRFEIAPVPEVTLDLDAYCQHQRSQLAVWEQQYAPLDVDSVVALAGLDLHPVSSSRLALTEALVQQKRLIVLGGAGAGKTTSLLFLAGSVLPGGSLAGSVAGLVPIYIELGRFRVEASSPLDNLLSLVADTLYRGKACQEPPPLRETRKLLSAHQFLFLLDGLNEASPEVRASCLAAIDDLAKRYPDHRIVLSSRLHGFFPPQGWNLVVLRELEDAQIPEFVERYTQGGTNPPLLQSVLEAHNPLLRLPLFLSLVVRMSGSPLPDLKRRLRSRSGLVAEYVESLLQRDLSSPAEVLSLDRLRDALDRLAQAFQASGQVLPLAEARRIVAATLSDRAEEVGRILDELCERGLLATDGQNLRFWHQTIQEYFYAGSIVRRWRGSKRQIGRMARVLRRLVGKPEEEEALGFMVAHLCDKEAATALRYGLAINPALAVSWCDDLSLEGRAVQATEPFPARARRFALAARRYSTLGKDRASILLAVAFLGPLVSFVLVGLLVWGSEGLMKSGLGLTSNEVNRVGGLAILGGVCLGCLLFLDALLCPSVEKLESLLGAGPEVRDSSLRKALGTVAREISASRLTRKALRALAQGVSGMDVVNAEELILVLRASDAPYEVTRLIGHLDTPFAFPFLVELVKLDNSFSEAALQALATRARRLRDERQKIKNLFWAVWNNAALDYLIRRRARKHLLSMGERPGGRGLLFRYFLLRGLRALPIALCVAGIYFSLSLKFLLPFLSGLSALVWWDARRMGARSIQGSPRFENGEPWNYALGVLILPYLVIPGYLLNRQRIRRDATPVDWPAILETLNAAAGRGISGGRV